MGEEKAPWLRQESLIRSFVSHSLTVPPDRFGRTPSAPTILFCRGRTACVPVDGRNGRKETLKTTDPNCNGWRPTLNYLLP